MPTFNCGSLSVAAAVASDNVPADITNEDVVVLGCIISVPTAVLSFDWAVSSSEVRGRFFFITLPLMPTLDCGSLSVAAAAASGNASADITNEDVKAIGRIISVAVLRLFVGVNECTDFNRLLRLSINNCCPRVIECSGRPRCCSCVVPKNAMRCMIVIHDLGGIHFYDSC